MRFRLPGLHSLHWKIFIFHMIILIVPTAYVAFQVRRSIETSYLHATEDGMIDTAALSAELYGQALQRGLADPQRVATFLGPLFSEVGSALPIKARVFGFKREETNTRIVFRDRKGRVIFDTGGPSSGKSSMTSDVREALTGRYGSRWEKDQAAAQVLLYSSLPVMVDGRVAGAVTVSKSTGRIRGFVARSLIRLLLPAAIALLAATGMAYAMSAYITRIVWSLAHRAERVAAGESNVRLETWTRSELGTLARAVEKMRRKLEGRDYVENMVTNLSHELKTPLAAIRGSAEVLEDGAIDSPADRARFLSNIQSEVARLDQIVANLLALARIEAGPADDHPADLGEVAATLAERYQARAEQALITFAAELPESRVMVPLREEQLELLLGSLLDNALQFTPPGGRIQFTLTAGDQATIAVADTGQGIEDELKPKIFDRFFTTANPRTGNRGTGLGLAIARSIVESRRGSITVESKPARGSTFTVVLPLA